VRVLITGATGNVGSSLVPRLAGHPEVDSVVTLARRPRQAEPGVEVVTADLVRDQLEPVLDGVDAVVHLAWAIQPSRRPTRLWDVNVVGTRRLLAATAAAGVGAFVHASSVGAYAPRPRGAEALTPVGEDHPTDGLATSSYALAKAYVERCLDAFEVANQDVRVVRLRPSIIGKGAGGARVRRLFLGPLVPRRLLAPERLPVLPAIDGAGFQLVHTDDVADAFVRAVTQPVDGAFNVTADPWLSFGDIARALGTRAVPLPGPIGRAAVTATWRARLQPLDAGWLDLARFAPVLDAARARTELGWQPRMRAEEVLVELLEGVAEGRGGPTDPLTPDVSGVSGRVRELVTAGQGAREVRP
jgi:UDP-glucose 4-epimerase